LSKKNRVVVKLPDKVHSMTLKVKNCNVELKKVFPSDNVCDDKLLMSDDIRWSGLSIGLLYNVIM
jgi:hypothetical protein